MSNLGRDEFIPRSLSPEQVGGLYGEALVQAEAQVANAWINAVLAPHEASRRAAYEQAAERLEALRADFVRVLGYLQGGAERSSPLAAPLGIPPLEVGSRNSKREG
jgi:hypothetical protein